MPGGIRCLLADACRAQAGCSLERAPRLQRLPLNPSCLCSTYGYSNQQHVCNVPGVQVRRAEEERLRELYVMKEPPQVTAAPVFHFT
jgi:hypothetical protein